MQLFCKEGKSLQKKLCDEFWLVIVSGLVSKKPFTGSSCFLIIEHGLEAFAHRFSVKDVS